jgi:hypothetical protein
MRAEVVEMLDAPVFFFLLLLFSYSDGRKPGRMRSEPNRFAFARCNRDRGRPWLDGPGGWCFA